MKMWLQSMVGKSLYSGKKEQSSEIFKILFSVLPTWLNFTSMELKIFKDC